MNRCLTCDAILRKSEQRCYACDTPAPKQRTGFAERLASLIKLCFLGSLLLTFASLYSAEAPPFATCATASAFLGIASFSVSRMSGASHDA